MSNESFEQITLEEFQIDAPEFLKDGQMVEVVVHAETEKILSCELPQFVELEITYSEPGLKGDTATNAMKPATLETGAEVNVPLFCDIGDVIRIDTKTGQYSERVKK
jgi:elongation factor P